MANGFAQFVSSLAAAQGFGNGPLPLISRSLTETLGDENGNDIPPLVDALKPLLDYSEQLINATVGCGTNIGDDDALPDRLHRQPDDEHARLLPRADAAPVDATSVDWAVPAGVSATDPHNERRASTISPRTRRADAVFKMTARATSPLSPS